MLGSIEELEKDIELFHNNVAASNELCALLEQVVSQIDQQNVDFNRESANVLSKLDGIPSSIDAANNANNAIIKKNVADEFKQAIYDFSTEQDKYVKQLEQVKQEIQLYIEQSKSQTETYSHNTALLTSRVESVPAEFDNVNRARNNELCESIKNELQGTLQSFTHEQEKYIQSLELVQEAFKAYIDQSKNNIQDFKTKADELSEMIERTSEQIKNDTRASLHDHRIAVDSDIEKRNWEFAETQQQYTAELQGIKDRLNSCEEQLLNKYKEFIQTLENTNLANIYEQNQKLQAEVNKRTNIIMVISAAAVVLGIAGLFLR